MAITGKVFFQVVCVWVCFYSSYFHQNWTLKHAQIAPDCTDLHLIFKKIPGEHGIRLVVGRSHPFCGTKQKQNTSWKFGRIAWLYLRGQWNKWFLAYVGWEKRPCSSPPIDKKGLTLVSCKKCDMKAIWTNRALADNALSNIYVRTTYLRRISRYQQIWPLNFFSSCVCVFIPLISTRI